MERNVNEPEFEEEEGIYRDRKDDEDEEIIPVEYLSYVLQTRKARIAHFFWGVLLAIVIFGIAPSMKGQEVCPRCGRTRSCSTLAWGYWRIVGVGTVETSWTEWYESLTPEDHWHHWVRAGKSHPGLFIFLTTHFSIGKDWFNPDNLIERMEDLNQIRYFRPGKVLEIPRILRSVNTEREWNAIIGPLTVGTTQDASDWWHSHRDELIEWSIQPLGTPLSDDFIYASWAYVEEMIEPDGYIIPIGPGS